MQLGSEESKRIEEPPESVGSVSIGLIGRGLGDSDGTVIAQWLHGRSPRTVRAYAGDVARFQGFVGVPIGVVSLDTLQSWTGCDYMATLSAPSRCRAIAAVKSLFSFAHRLGYIALDAAAPLRTGGFKDRLAERILPESDIRRILSMEPDPRNSVLLLVLYASGARVSEICALTWADCQPREVGGQITVFGKGEKTRAVPLPTPVWSRLESLRDPISLPESAVFVSRNDGALSPGQVRNIVRAASVRAGIDRPVSPHWLRHAHATYALRHGASLSLVKEILGHSSSATTDRYVHVQPAASSADFLGL